MADEPRIKLYTHIITKQVKVRLLRHLVMPIQGPKGDVITITDALARSIGMSAPHNDAIGYARFLVQCKYAEIVKE